jgi:predicted porin
MKKHLIALAVAGAIAAPAMAQNVAVYGLVDASVSQGKTNGVTNVTAQGNGDYLGSSVLGFKGTEDLGGGMKAEFKLEGDLNVGNGTGDGSGGGLTFDRQSYVGLSSAAGSIQVGRMSDFADSSYGTGMCGANLCDTDRNAKGGKNANTTQVSTKIGAATVTASYSNDTGAAAAGSAQGTSSSVIGAAFSMSGVDFRVGYVEQGATKQQLIAATTMVGAAKVGALLTAEDSGAAANANSGQFIVSVQYPLGNGVTARAQYQTVNNDTATSEENNYAVLVDKALSKRTSVYAGYRSVDKNNGNTGDETLSVIGLQHSF